jgi:peptidylprolyl isomerase
MFDILRRSCVGVLIASALIFTTHTTKAEEMTVKNPEDTLVMKLKSGDVVIALDTENAPNHAARLKELSREGFYDGIVFHRVIDGFMAQTGDPTGTGMGGSGQKLKAEFSDAPFKRGTVGMARSSDPNSADSQFFINFEDTPHLNGQYTVIGNVVSGMEHVDNIKKGNSAANGQVDNPDSIISMRVMEDEVAPAE